MMRKLFCLLLLTACAMPKPPAPAPERPPAQVAASFGKTWDAVIDQFATGNVPIRTMERASGFVAAEAVSVQNPARADEPSPWADCGTGFGGFYEKPYRALYNVRVRGDSAHSTVSVTVRWLNEGAKYPCQTKGLWEADFENAVKRRAEKP